MEKTSKWWVERSPQWMLNAARRAKCQTCRASEASAMYRSALKAALCQRQCKKKNHEITAHGKDADFLCIFVVSCHVYCTRWGLKVMVRKHAVTNMAADVLLLVWQQFHKVHNKSGCCSQHNTTNRLSLIGTIKSDHSNILENQNLCHECCEDQWERPLQGNENTRVPDVHICKAAFFNGLLLPLLLGREHVICRKELGHREVA